MTRTTLAIIFSSLISLPALCDNLCRNDVTYAWKRGEDPESTLFFSTVEATGADEALAKQNLLEKTSLEKLKASESCRKLHENSAGCLNAKLAASSANLASLNFASRKAVEIAAVADCEKQAGKCTGISSTEPACSVVADAKASASASPEAGGKAGAPAKKGKK